MAKTQRKERVIGWREWVALGDLGVERIKAKIDTGARTSAIHAFNIRELTIDGVRHVEFWLHPVQRKRRPQVRCVAPIHEQRYVRSSSGEQQYRYVIRTHVRIGRRRRLIELSLAQRDIMGFRMLIGRSALPRGMLVDPNKSYLTADGAALRKPARAKTKPKTKAKQEMTA